MKEVKLYQIHTRFTIIPKKIFSLAELTPIGKAI